MKPIFRIIRLPLLSLLLLLPAGCNRTAAPLTPLPVEEIPVAFERTFSRASTETKALASQLAASVRAQDYSKAFADLEVLAGQAGLNKEQSLLVARSRTTLQGLLESAQTKGDAQAAEVLRIRRQNR